MMEDVIGAILAIVLVVVVIGLAIFVIKDTNETSRKDGFCEALGYDEYISGFDVCRKTLEDGQVVFFDYETVLNQR